MPSSSIRAPRVSPKPAGGRERGSALLLALILGVFVTAMVFNGEASGKASAERLGVEFAARGQAPSVAEAGIVDALAWLRRQTVQPVTDLTPMRDLTAEPAINETDDPALGIVREFEITSGIWGRYEVRRGRPMDPFTDSNLNGVRDESESFQDLTSPPDGTSRASAAMTRDRDGAMRDGYADGEWTPSRWSRDVSAERGISQPGTVWRLESRGLVFARPEMDRPLGQGRNILLGSATVATEVQRLTMSTPAAAALCAPREGAVVLGTRVRIRSDQLAIGLGSADGALSTTSTTELLAPSTSAVVPGYQDGVTNVFGVDWAQLKAMAEISTRRLAGIPDTINDLDLVVLERDVVYDAERPLQGTGILVVRGDVTITAGSSSFFTGLLYVDGDLTVDGPAFLRGSVVVTGTATLRGSSGDYVEVEHDSGSVSQLLAKMGRYRVTRATYTPDRDLVDTTVTSEASPVELEFEDPLPDAGSGSGGADAGAGSGGGDAGGGDSGGTGGGSGDVGGGDAGDDDDAESDDDDRPRSRWGRSWRGWGDRDEDYDWRDDRRRRGRDRDDDDDD